MTRRRRKVAEIHTPITVILTVKKARPPHLMTKEDIVRAHLSIQNTHYYHNVTFRMLACNCS